MMAGRPRVAINRWYPLLFFQFFVLFLQSFHITHVCIPRSFSSDVTSVSSSDELIDDDACSSSRLVATSHLLKSDYTLCFASMQGGYVSMQEYFKCRVLPPYANCDSVIEKYPSIGGDWSEIFFVDLFFKYIYSLVPHLTLLIFPLFPVCSWEHAGCKISMTWVSMWLPSAHIYRDYDINQSFLQFRLIPACSLYGYSFITTSLSYVAMAQLFTETKCYLSLLIAVAHLSPFYLLHSHQETCKNLDDYYAIDDPCLHPTTTQIHHSLTLRKQQEWGNYYLNLLSCVISIPVFIFMSVMSSNLPMPCYLIALPIVS